MGARTLQLTLPTHGPDGPLSYDKSPRARALRSAANGLGIARECSTKRPTISLRTHTPILNAPWLSNVKIVVAGHRSLGSDALLDTWATVSGAASGRNVIERPTFDVDRNSIAGGNQLEATLAGGRFRRCMPNADAVCRP